MLPTTASGTVRFASRTSPAGTAAYSKPDIMKMARNAASTASPGTSASGAWGAKRSPANATSTSGAIFTIERTVEVRPPSFTPSQLTNPSAAIRATAIGARAVDAAGTNRPSAVANPRLTAASPRTPVAIPSQPTPNPTYLPKASRAYTYGPPLRSYIEDSSATESAIRTQSTPQPSTPATLLPLPARASGATRR